MHNDYADLEPWSGCETSDIVYDDTEGVLTSILVEKGYLSEEHWNGETPSYFIEVKTTVNECSTQFFMSHDQYQRVSSCA